MKKFILLVVIKLIFCTMMFAETPKVAVQRAAPLKPALADGPPKRLAADQSLFLTRSRGNAFAR